MEVSADSFSVRGGINISKFIAGIILAQPLLRAGANGGEEKQANLYKST
jgi:hypothetical protein